MYLRAILPLLALILAGETVAAVSSEYQTATQARISGTYVMVVFANGSKAMVPIASLKPEDHEWLVALSRQKPMAGGKSTVTIVAAESPVAKTKNTITVSSVEGPLETIQLCPPNVMRDQIGGTCMLYARIHWLDIAGYYTQTPEIYKIINGTPPDSPWSEPRYVEGLFSVFTSHKPSPARHRLPPQEEPFEWARSQLRKGRPLLAAFPREIWQALPPGFIAAHSWSGGTVGHQIVINGFTWNKETRKGTFRIINSWAELPEFDLTTEAAGGGALVIEESLSPIGEVSKEPAGGPGKEVVKSIRLIKPVGAVNLYEVETTHGTRRMVAASEDAVRELVEKP
ncbi:MAG: hypothetical protein K0R17_1864 [Rariglobus sp.]|jgi:hypothetical protein|nr:hypothetical protein [Rariglobus sp.]